MLRRILARATFRRPPPVVAVVRLTGVIGHSAGPFGTRLSLQAVEAPIQRAFRLKGLKAVVLEINSPGGSPVQSALIHARIRALADERSVPVMAFVEDVAASGAYWIASAADEIFVEENSIVGSIGVVYHGFGFDGALRKLGIERRLYTAGERKSLMDPFSPLDPSDVARLRAIQEEMHGNFKALVRTRRAGRLKGDEADLFSGEFWLGRKAVALGLADGIGDARTVLRERFGPRMVLRRTWRRRGWLQRRLAPAMTRAAGESFGALPVGEALGALEDRAWWSRYGL